VAACGKRLSKPRKLFLLTLLWTGTRVSECLALTAASFQLQSGIVSVVTLKRRCPVVREVPVPDALVEALNREFGLSRRQSQPRLTRKRLWGFSRWTAWRLVKAVMTEAGISGCSACPRGLRHGFGAGAVQAGIPVTLLQRWLGHARLETTAIYANLSGPEERDIAGKFWSML